MYNHFQLFWLMRHNYILPLIFAVSFTSARSIKFISFFFLKKTKFISFIQNYLIFFYFARHFSYHKSFINILWFVSYMYVTLTYNFFDRIVSHHKFISYALNIKLKMYIYYVHFSKKAHAYEYERQMQDNIDSIPNTPQIDYPEENNNSGCSGRQKSKKPEKKK